MTYNPIDDEKYHEYYLFSKEVVICTECQDEIVTSDLSVSLCIHCQDRKQYLIEQHENTRAI